MGTTITRCYKFYAAHRNENLVRTKCSSLHGHVYRFEVEIDGNLKNESTGVSMLFEDIDMHIKPFVDSFDHSVILHERDPLLMLMVQFNDTAESPNKIVELPFPTSAENLAMYLYMLIKKTGLPILEIRLKETDSSTVTYNKFN